VREHIAIALVGRISRVSPHLILCHIAERVLGLPKLYQPAFMGAKLDMPGLARKDPAIALQATCFLIAFQLARRDHERTKTFSSRSYPEPARFSHS
jgi:hypothetical protein